MDIQLDSVVLNHLQEQIYDKTSLEEAEMVYANFNVLKQAAIHFINTLSTIDSNNTHINASGITLSDYARAKKQIRDSLDNKLVTKAIIDFEDAFNGFLGRNIALTLVTDDGEIQFFDSKSQLEIYQASSKNKARLNLNWSGTNGGVVLSEIFDSVFETAEQQAHAHLVQLVYTTSVDRYNETHAGSKNSDNNFIYWHERARRVYAYVKNKGLLGEGYTLAMFTQADKSGFNNILDPDDLQNFYYKYILQADNRAGSVIGDIAQNILGPMQLAVKNRKASSQTFSNLITIAEMIINSESNMTPTQVAIWLRKQELDKSKREFPNSPLIKNSLSKKVTNAIKEATAGQGYSITYAD